MKIITKNGDEITKAIYFRLQFIDSTRFMANSFSNLVNNLPAGIHKIKCKYRHDDKKCEACGIKYKDCECCLEYKNIKDGLILYKCLYCNKYYTKDFHENLTKRFANTQFILLLRKGRHRYQYMDD